MKTYNTICGIYFLWKNGECVYVGQSRDAMDRIKRHKGRIAFDKFTIMQCEDYELDAYESRMIRALEPVRNDIVPEEKSFPKLDRHMHARYATLDELIQSSLPTFLQPVPHRDTLRTWFDKARIPRTKANPSARRGGGLVFYSVSAIEKFLVNRALPGRLHVTAKILPFSPSGANVHS